MDASPSLFQKIYRLGDRMCNALKADRMQSFAALTEERTLLINRLRKYDHPSEVDPDWERWRQRLDDQHQRLTSALKARTDSMAETAGELERFKQANQQYSQGSASNTSTLHHHLAM